MSKQKQKKQRTSPPSRGAQPSRQPASELPQALRQAEKLIDDRRHGEAITLLEPLLSRYPRVAELHYYHGYACLQVGNLWAGLAGYERAVQWSRDPAFWLPLAWLYLRLEMNVHALQAFRQALRGGVDASEVGDVRAVVGELDDQIRQTASELRLQVPQVERGLRSLEVGIRALEGEDYGASVVANRQAVKVLGSWPPANNNLALALFFEGRPQEAMTIGQRVLSQNPNNLHALANAIRFLAWTGREEEARALWQRLQAVEPQDADDRFKMAEAAAILNQDRLVWELLQPLDRADATPSATPPVLQRVQLFLAIAEANLGKPAAQHRLKALQPTLPWAGDLLAALQAGKPGLGWASRFPYFSLFELIPRSRMLELVDLMGRQDRMPEKRFQEQMARLAERFPQLVLVGEKMIWEEEQAGVGITLLKAVATPAAYATLRRFGLSQAGDDDMRMDALFALAEAGEIGPDERLRVWHGGKWQEIELRQYDVSEDQIWNYSPEVIELMNQGLHAFGQDDLEQAERLLRRVLELNPAVKEAHYNLGALYARRGDMDRTRELYQSALELDPLYVYPRCSLALHLLNNDDLAGATAMLQPLANVTHFHPQEMALYSYAQACIFLEQEEYEQARRALEAALELKPDYEPARDLLGRLDLVVRMRTGFHSFFEQQHQRRQARRARLQATLTTADPSLAEALSLYTKEALTGMGRVILPWGGWSALRKAELCDRILAGFDDPEDVEWIVKQLKDTDRAALHRVVAHGGHLPWSEFDAAYGNDLEESPYWQWHVPQTTMGRLRHRGLLVEATVDGQLLVVVPLELRPVLAGILGIGDAVGA